MKLYKFYWDCGRQGFIDGIFAATDEEYSKLIGSHIYFGEALGKHSDIHGEMEEEDVVMLTDDQDFIDKAIKFGLVPCGYNPLEYIE